MRRFIGYQQYRGSYELSYLHGLAHETLRVLYLSLLSYFPFTHRGLVRLSPCGHVLCQTCLQEWFRSAPASDDEMFDDSNPDPLLYRKKICPVCRTVVRARPIPLFVLKNIADLLEKAKGSNHQISPVPEIDSVDPWAGIFFELASEPSDSEEDDSDDDDDEDEDEDDEDEEEGDYDDDQWSDEGYGTPDDGEPYEGPYVRPHWSPPTVNVSPDDFPTFVRHLSPTDLSMLSRGATLQMIMLFRMSYSHQDGLRAIVDGSNVVYLGWNVELVPEDENGEEFMEWVTKDMHERPERWEKEEAPDGTWTARKLVPAEDDEDEEEYYTSDSDVWAADLAAESGYSLF